MTSIGPFLVHPAFDEKPWGGRRLAEFGFDLPDDRPIGEALITASEARVASGTMSGRTLGEVVARDPQGCLGRDGLAATSNIPIFSLLIKIIDAKRPLSIQVHPSDENAPSGRLGKTEAWHVLKTDPGAVMYLGPAPGIGKDELAEAARLGSSMGRLMRTVPVVPGMSALLPAGTLHALGGGIVIYEIQQPSTITYRLDDWRDPNDPTPPREMHIEQGLAVLRPEFRPELMPLSEDSTGSVRRLVECQYFALDRIELTAQDEARLPGLDGPRTLTCLNGEARLQSAAGGLDLHAGQTAVLLAGEGELFVRAASGAVLLAGSVPAAHCSDSVGSGSSNR